VPAVSFLPLRQSNNLATRVSDSDIFGAGILTPEGVDDTIFASCAESVGELNASALHVIEVPMQFATGGVERVLLLLGMAAVEQWSSILSRITEQSLR
jgi:hypothetical protein